MPTRTDCLLNTNTCADARLWQGGIAILLLVGVLACTSQRPSAPESKQAAAVIQAVLANFTADWGMPGHPEAVPRTCYVRNMYASPDRDDMRTAIAIADGDGARAATAAIQSAPRETLLPVFNFPCKLSTPEEVRKLESGTHVYAGGIVIVSHAGFDSSGDSAAVLLTESRGDLAGSTWLVLLRRTEKSWLVVQRKIVSQS